MSFEFTARSVLQLGSELISSDAVALAELIKNSIDAGSKSGARVTFEVVLRHADLEAALAILDEEDQEEEGEDAVKIERARTLLLDRTLNDAPSGLRDQFRSAVQQSFRSVGRYRRAITGAYQECNRITVADDGHGMSLEDLRTIYLTIGTTNRAKALRKAAAEGLPPPYLGEKGIGRLSVMRLGSRVRIETASSSDRVINVLDIDWTKFEEADDQPAGSVKVAPVKNGPNTKGASFTTIVIMGLRSSWSLRQVSAVATQQLARLLDPFSWMGKRRFQIQLEYNGVPVHMTRSIATELLRWSHAVCKGTYVLHDGSPSMTVTLESSLYEGPRTTHTFDLSDLMTMSGLRDERLPSAILRRLGPFSFEFYWFNRQRLRGLPDVGDREVVRDLIRTWSGIGLYRDGYRVLPYGDEGDDWLGLDREALSASGYKLNTKQIIGRVLIGRTSNPKLLDQTNRQGLVDSSEKRALVDTLNVVISRWWRNYLNEATAAQKRQKLGDFNAAEEGSVVEGLETRAKVAIRKIRQDYTGDGAALQQVQDLFREIRDAHERAIARIEAIEDQNERLTQLAGIGLMIEMIAHELARATEATLETLKEIRPASVDDKTAASLRVLGAQTKVIQRRLQILEPLSVPSRQRRSVQSVSRIVDYVLSSHAAQFERHRIDVKVAPPKVDLAAFVIEGHVVQILENLVANSVYWLDLEKAEHEDFRPEIRVQLLSDPPRIRFRDNGPGIPEARSELVFEPFFSTKRGGQSRRRGLGLYIARQNAEGLGGELGLVENKNDRPGRLNTFELTLLERAP